MRILLFSLVLWSILGCQPEGTPPPADNAVIDTTAVISAVGAATEQRAEPATEAPIQLPASAGKAISPGYEKMAGNWTTKARRPTTIVITERGTMTISAEGWPSVEGSFTMQGNRITLLSSSQLMCTDQPGTYDVYFSPDWNTLFFELVTDDCEMRMRRMRKSFTRL